MAFRHARPRARLSGDGQEEAAGRQIGAEIALYQEMMQISA
jgi:hypothetical protein